RRGNEQVVAALAPAAPAAAPESADLAAVRQRFETALKTLRHARFGAGAGAGAGASGGPLVKLRQRWSGRYLYQLPWYLIVGAPGSGKTTALRNAGLQFPLAAQMGDEALRGVSGTRDCQWWFTDRAVLIDTAGRFTTQDSDAAGDQATWTGFLDLLKRSRPRQPLNGVLVTVAAGDLLARGAAERLRYAQQVQLRLQELQRQLRLELPVYLLVTKVDLMAGFADVFAGLEREQRATPWGCTFALEPAQAWQQALAPELEALLQRLQDGLIDRLQAEPDAQRRARIYGFPHQFAALRAPLLEFVQQVFTPTPFGDAAQLRGVYLVSGTQEGSPIDRVLGAVARRFRIEQAVLPPQRASGRSYFIERLLTEVVFAEQGLAGTDRRWERRRGALLAGAHAALALLAFGTVAAWWTSWRGNAAYVERVAARVETVRREVLQTPNRATPDLAPILPALDATRGLAADGGADAGRGVPAGVPWRLGFGLYQGRKLDSAANQAYRHMLTDAVLPRLALRLEQQLRADEPPEVQYEALKAYLMMYEPAHFDAAALKDHFEADWDARQAREITPEQRAAMSRHLDALLAQGAAVSPLPQDRALVATLRNQLAAVSLPQRVYHRLRRLGSGLDAPEFTVVGAGGPNAQLVFARASGLPLTRGVPGLYTYDGYHHGFQKVVAQVTRQLASEQTWVLGIAPGSAGAGALDSAQLVDDVRRLYLEEYRDTWKAFIADVRLQPPTSIAQALEMAHVLSAADNPLVPLMKAMSRQTTLLGAGAGAGLGEQLARKGDALASQFQARLRGATGQAGAGQGAQPQRIESIVDDEFAGLRRYVTAPEGGGKAPIDGVVERLQDLQQLLLAVQQAVEGGNAPPPSPLPNQIKVEASNAPQPVRAILETLGGTSARIALLTLRENLARDVRTQIGDFCNQAISGRYPFDPSATREVRPADFAALFGPGGKFEQMQQKLAMYIDTGTRPWSFRPIDGVPLGSDVGTLPQFQRAAVIRETFFQGGATVPTTRLEFKPVEMDPRLHLFTLDVDGQIVRYDQGPQIPQPVRWPGPRGSDVVRVMVDPATGGGLVNDGPWALYRLFDRVTMQPGSAPEKFRATFDIDGRKTVFDITSSSVRNPLRLAELRAFRCPEGL
ncbi:MAG: type VI secretion system membrane subunit TssM, partial [Burkholderiales bacterium]|nr:type VI secretion system membrane subunit TssM [Burkholderiales bacterium]